MKREPADPPTPPDPEKDKADLIVVGIGASAGGIKALKQFFAAMPDEPGMAFVVVLHLSPQHESNLDAILQAESKMPVIQVNETVPVKPNEVYVIPPNKNLAMVDGVIRLEKPENRPGPRIVIDYFFRTLAEAYGQNAVCVVLSGSGSDGTLGLKQVKERNGFAIAQDPDDAEYDSMPRSAIATNLVDWILPAEHMPRKLIGFKRSSERLHLTGDYEKKAPLEITGGEELREILTLIRLRTGHDFSNYKQPTLLRRIARHLQIHELEDIGSYLKLLRDNPHEMQSLLKNLLINVTNFFRDKEAFGVLEKEILPQLFAGKTGRDSVRVWSAGCATGEEAYSLGMLLAEYAEHLNDPPKLQVFASDVDEDAIVEARQHCYPETIEVDVTPERLRRFFVKEGDVYRVRKDLREIVLFASHNILRDPPFSRLDLAVCRNLLIYLNRDTQDQVLQILHFALKPSGFLFLGSSESAESQTVLYAPVDKKNRIYSRRTNQINKAAPILPLKGDWKIKVPESFRARQRERLHSLGEVHYKLVEQYAPPSVLVNEDFDIVHLSESAGRYLRFTGGEPSNNLLKAVHPDLLPDLRGALFATQREGHSAEIPNIRIELEGKEIFVNLIVRPVEITEAERDFSLVIFAEAGAADVEPSGTEGESTPQVEKDVAMESVVRRMEEDLRRTKDRLRTTIEQHETSIEELKASNEELQAINEELRSASEELETSKEELQSVNEELTTVNHELKDKIDETGRINSDLQNLMASTDIGTIFLDRALKIKRYTPQVQDIFNIIPGDIGRPLEHVTHKLDYANLAADATAVLRTLKPIEREIGDKQDNIYILRILPYRTVDDKIEGVVLTFINITERKNAEDAVAGDLRATRILADHNARLISNMNSQAIYQEILETAILLTDADAGTVQILDENAKELIMVAAQGFDQTMTQRFHRVAAGSKTTCGMALIKNERIVLDYDDPKLQDMDGEMQMHVNAGYLSGQSTPLSPRSGKPLGMVSTHWRNHRRPGDRELRFLDLLSRQAADLIEQHRGEEAQEESEIRLKLIMDSVTDYAIITTDVNGIINGWNPGAERMFGYTPEEILGKTAHAIFTPEDRANGVPEREMSQALRDGRAEDERWHLHQDGTRFYVSGVMTVLKDGGVEGFVKIARDQTEKISAERILREKEILQKLVRAQEDERRRIARDLHDELGQQLTALRLKLEGARGLTTDPELTAQFEELQTSAREIDEGLDFLAWELRPASLDDLGLIAALEKYVNEWTRYANVPAHFIARLPKDDRFPFEIETNLYRIAQEALNNVYKHAAAGRVEISLLRRDAQLILLIEDDGRGFVPEENMNRATGIGLVGMQERAVLVGGSIEIESAPGSGTRIFVRIPYTPEG